MPSTIHLVNGEKIRSDDSPADVNRFLTTRSQTESGLCALTSVVGEVFVNPAQVTHIAEGGR
jgi:uncharacterized protein YfcZ (UPF0381/DUF406 family)